MNEKLSLACMRRLKRERDEARKWSAAWKKAAVKHRAWRRSLAGLFTTQLKAAVEARQELEEVKAELAEMTRDRDYWKLRAQCLEARRVEGLAPPYKFGGEGVA